MATGDDGRALAAIDIGTNSIHLVVARVGPGERMEVVAQEKEVVRLGSGSGDMKELQPDAIERGVAALQRMRRVAESSGASVRAVATSAVREAENRDEFVRRARDEAGVEVEVVSGVEEARIIHLGVLQAVPVFDRRLLLIDIGGGSTELLVGEGRLVLDARSLKLGAIRLTDRFFTSEPLKAKAVKECRDYVRSFASQALRDVRRHGFDVLVGSSGTILNVAEMALARRGEAGRDVGNAEITVAEVDEVVESLVGAPTAAKRLGIAGLDPKRADIIVGGAVLLQQLLHDLRAGSLVVSTNALREGLLLDTLRRDHAAALHHLGDIRAASVRHLADLVPDEVAHGRHAARLALRLFDETAGRHGLGDDARELLEAAALLANVGLVIAHDRHHLHAYYVIRNAESLTGFTQREVELIAQVARYHRKSAPKAKHEAFAALEPADQRVVRALAGILRVGVALDRGHAGVVHHLDCREDGDRIVVTVHAAGDASLELYTASHRTDLLEEVLGTAVTFEDAAVVARPPIEVRDARRHEVPAIVALLADDVLGRHREDAVDPLPAAYWEAFAAVEADPRTRLLVAVDGEEVVGVLQLSILPGLSLRGATRAEVEGVRVAAGRRSSGIGRQLLGRAAEEARDRGCQLLQLTTDRRRSDARRFYESLGFEATHDGMKLRL